MSIFLSAHVPSFSPDNMYLSENKERYKPILLMVQKSCTKLILGKYPFIYWVSYIPGGWEWDFFHQPQPGFNSSSKRALVLGGVEDKQGETWKRHIWLLVRYRCSMYVITVDLSTYHGKSQFGTI